MTSSERLRTLIKELNETQTSFAKRIDVPQSTISNTIMRNSNLNSQLLGRIIKVYPLVDIGWLMAGTGNMFKEPQKSENTMRGRINLFREAEKISIQDIAKALNESASDIKPYITGESTPNYGFIKKLSNAFPRININWLLTGEGEMLRDSSNPEEGEGLNLNVQTRPRIPYTAAAGSLTNSEAGVTLADCEQLPIIHQFPAYDFTMFIKGDSMSPRYESGDEIACRKIDQARFIQWGKPHVLDTTQGIIVKRVYEDGDNIRCVSYNPNYTDFSIPKEDIYSMSLVVGSLNISEM